MAKTNLTDKLADLLPQLDDEAKRDVLAYMLTMIKERKQEPPKQEAAPPPEQDPPPAVEENPEPLEEEPPAAAELLTVQDVARKYDLTERHARRMVKGMAHTIIKGDGKRWRYAIARDIFEEGLKHQSRAF